MYQRDYKAAISNGCLVSSVMLSDVDERVREEGKIDQADVGMSRHLRILIRI